MPVMGNITVENKLVTERRAVSVYHHATRGAHLISHNSSVMLPLKPAAGEDYFHISVPRGPGRLECDCVVDLPYGLDFEFAGEGKVVITHKGGRVLVKIPAGPPLWQLKLTRPVEMPPGGPTADSDFSVIIGEIEKTSLKEM